MSEKKKLHKNPDSRRKFLGKSIFMGAGMISGTADFLPEQQKVKMLTPDGKLVEIDPSAIRNKSRKIKNQELLEWMDRDRIIENLKNKNK